ncbi:MAG: carboxypeptidase regulatory-like domain-containing protein [Thermoguttaceae bacterium]|nr:carboxypeptidase regulatory-like domain-containing protein [Thermoguttaceae bacterium]
MKRVIALLLAVAFVAALGCGKGPKKPADLPKLFPATVTVTYDNGEAVPGATVVLFTEQKSGGRSWNVAGVTDDAGKLVLKTDGNWDGVPAGNYTGMVTKEVSEMGETDAETGAIKVNSITRVIDKRFGDPGKSGLAVTIQEGPNEIEFKVGEKISENVPVMN